MQSKWKNEVSLKERDAVKVEDRCVWQIEEMKSRWKLCYNIIWQGEELQSRWKDGEREGFLFRKNDLNWTFFNQTLNVNFIIFKNIFHGRSMSEGRTYVS